MDTKIVQLVEAGDTEENSIQINDQVAPQSIPTDTLKKTEYDVEIWDNLAPNSVPAGNKTKNFLLVASFFHKSP